MCLQLLQSCHCLTPSLVLSLRERMAVSLDACQQDVSPQHNAGNDGTCSGHTCTGDCHASSGEHPYAQWTLFGPCFPAGLMQDNEDTCRAKESVHLIICKTSVYQTDSKTINKNRLGIIYSVWWLSYRLGNQRIMVQF